MKYAAFDTKTIYSEERTHLVCLMVPIAKSNIAIPDNKYSIAESIVGSSSEVDMSLMDRKKSTALSIKRIPSAQATSEMLLLGCANLGLKLFIIKL